MQDNITKSIEEHEAALVLKPQYLVLKQSLANLYFEQALLLLEAGNRSEALEYKQKIIQLVPESQPTIESILK